MKAHAPRTVPRTAVDACRYFGALIPGAIVGAEKEWLLSEIYSPTGKSGYWEQRPLSDEVAEVAAGSFKRKDPPEIKGSGYVVRSLEAALWAFHNSDSFEEGALLAVNLGDDADTTGAVYGQLAGAYDGEQAIPESWRRKARSSPAHRALRGEATLSYLNHSGVGKATSVPAHLRAPRLQVRPRGHEFWIHRYRRGNRLSYRDTALRVVLRGSRLPRRTLLRRCHYALLRLGQLA